MNTDKDKTEDLMQQVVRQTEGKQMTEEEYRYIASYLKNKNVLVFGTGYDSDLWRHTVKDGVIIFLEHNKEWITNDTDTFLVRYTTHKGRDAKRLLENYKKGLTSDLEINLPSIVDSLKWDVIIVDSPEGGKNCHPGRMQSIYAAKKLSTDSTEVFVHDCDREIEQLYSTVMFSKLIKEHTKLRHYRK